MHCVVTSFLRPHIGLYAYMVCQTKYIICTKETICSRSTREMTRKEGEKVKRAEKTEFEWPAKNGWKKKKKI